MPYNTTYGSIINKRRVIRRQYRVVGLIMPCDIDLVLPRAVGQGSAFADFRSYAQRSQRIVLAPDWSQMRKAWRKSRWLVAVHRKRTMWRMMESQEADGTSSRLRRWGALVSLGSDLVIASSSTPVLIRQTPLHYPRKQKKTARCSATRMCTLILGRTV